MNIIIKVILYKKVSRTKITNHVLFVCDSINIINHNHPIMDYSIMDYSIMDIYSCLVQNYNNNHNNKHIEITDHENNLSYVYLINDKYMYLIIINTINLGNIYPTLNKLIINISGLLSKSKIDNEIEIKHKSRSIQIDKDKLLLIKDLITNTNISLSNNNNNNESKIDIENNINETIQIIRTNVKKTIDNLKKADEIIDRLDQKTEINKDISSKGYDKVKQITRCLIM